MKKILGLFLGCLSLLAGCYEEEDLTPSSEPELIYGKYTLPQGDHDYDDDIVTFYKKYNSLLLYKFTSKDFGWTPTANMSWNMETDTVIVSGGEAKYDALPADELYVKAQLQLLEDKLFAYLSDTLMQLLPQRILLCSAINEVPVGLGYNPQPHERTPLNVYSGYYHIAVSWGNPKILTMTSEERKQFKIDLCSAYLRAVADVLEKPQEFFMVSNYSDDMSSAEIYNNGILNHRHRSNMKEDWFDYLKLAIENSMEELEAIDGVLSPFVDVNGKIREKYAIMTDFLKSQYQFDIQAIGNDAD